MVLDASGDPLNESARAVWRMAPAGTAIVNAAPGASGFGGAVEAAARAVAAGGTHASPLDAVRPEAGTEEYDEHEVVPLPVPVVVTRAGRVFPPASTVQDARKALWSRA